LTSGRDPFLGPALEQHLTALAELGVSEQTRRLNRNGWILVSVVCPERLPGWLAWQTRAMTDPEYRALYRQTDEAREWSADDPRLADLARRTAAWIVTVDTSEESNQVENAISAELVTSYDPETVPAWDRLQELIRAELARLNADPGRWWI